MTLSLKLPWRSWEEGGGICETETCLRLEGGAFITARILDWVVEASVH